MSFVTASAALFAPILGVLSGGIILAVVVVTVVSAVRGNGASAVAYFIFGLSLVSLAIVVITAGIVTHSVSELVGPSSSYSSTPVACSSSPSNTAVPLNSPIGSFCYGNGQNASASSSASSGSVDNSLTSVSNDETNHNISVSVLAGLFLVTAAASFVLLWRKARRLIADVGVGNPPLGLLPVTYGYLVAGIAVFSLLVFVPVFADNIFRAIAPGVNGTSGHADGLRNLVTYFVLAGLTGFILRYHLQYLEGLRNRPVAAVPEPGPPPGGPTEPDQG